MPSIGSWGASWVSRNNSACRLFLTISAVTQLYAIFALLNGSKNRGLPKRNRAIHLIAKSRAALAMMLLWKTWGTTDVSLVAQPPIVRPCSSTDALSITRRSTHQPQRSKSTTSHSCLSSYVLRLTRIRPQTLIRSLKRPCPPAQTQRWASASPTSSSASHSVLTLLHITFHPPHWNPLSLNRPPERKPSYSK